MAEEKVTVSKKKWRGAQNNAGGGAVYGLGLIGTLVYYLQNADTFWNGIWGVLKAIVWPAMMVYHLFSFLGL